MAETPGVRCKACAWTHCSGGFQTGKGEFSSTRKNQENPRSYGPISGPGSCQVLTSNSPGLKEVCASVAVVLECLLLRSSVCLMVIDCRKRVCRCLGGDLDLGVGRGAVPVLAQGDVVL